jgi:predicted nucleic acid-binding protein
VAQTIECIRWDAAISRRWARLVVDLRRRGWAMPLLDGMIAATALEHDLTVATGNVGDFRKAGVRVVDPFV